MMPRVDEQSWRATLVPLGATIQQAIYSLESSSKQIVIAVSSSNRLAGTLTDGDIRRAFLQGYNLDSVIDDVIHRNPLVVPPELGRSFVLQLMQINKIHQLPIVGQDGEVIGLHSWSAFMAPQPVESIMIIMAGGKGTRLRPYTENCPKPMLEVGGKPMLQHIIERAAKDGFQKFVISLHYMGHVIEDYFGDGSKFGVHIEYLKEDLPLGTAGCLSLLPEPPRLPFIVTNGDVLTDIHYNDILNFHMRHEAKATMAVRQHEIQNQFGVVQTKGIEIVGFIEKPVYHSHINAGIYAIDPEALSYLEPNNYCDMPTLFERIKKNAGRTVVYPMHELWLDVGRHEDLVKACQSTYE